LCKEKHFRSKVKILLVDFYDSFTYNLAHYLESLCDVVDVIRDNEIRIENIDQYDKIILSPGPGLPERTQSMKMILEKFSGKVPILGVCLGMQGIVKFLGGNLSQKEVILHGKPVQLLVEKQIVLFTDLPAKFNVGLYHSWEVKVPNDLKQIITAYDEFGVVMAIENRERKLFGVQFHPESILTEYGREILDNFCKHE
jgi:anthranilate synthase component 2